MLTKRESYPYCLLALLLTAGLLIPLLGDSGSIEAETITGENIPDPGIADTIRINEVEVEPGEEFALSLWLYHDENLSGGVIGLRWGSADIFLDSIDYDYSLLRSIPPAQRLQIIENGPSYQVLTGFSTSLEGPLPPAIGRWAIFWFTVSDSAEPQLIILDTAIVTPALDFHLNTHPDGLAFGPQLVAGRITIVAPEQNIPPAEFFLLSPAYSEIVFDLTPKFIWSRSIDSNTIDTVRYQLTLSNASDFQFSGSVTDISDTVLLWTDSLSSGTPYWWKVQAFDLAGATTESASGFFSTWLPGDINNSGEINVADILFLVENIFSGQMIPGHPVAGDVNGSCQVNIADALYLANWIFANGPAPLPGCSD